MAERRMFAKSVISGAKFLMLPTSTRLLYYDLGMRADDDGVVEAYGVMRETGAREDDLNLLVSKGFVTVLNKDEWVVYLNQWKLNNQLRPDRYKQGLHHDLLVSLLPEAEVTFNKKKEISDGEKPAESSGIPTVTQTDTSGIHSKVKGRKDKERKDNNKAPDGADVLMASFDLSKATEAQAAELKEAVNAFCLMRKRNRQPLNTNRAVTILRKKLLNLAGGDVALMIALLDQSTERGWASVFPLPQSMGAANRPNLGQPKLPGGVREICDENGQVIGYDYG